MMQGLRELWGKIQYNIKRVMDSDPAQQACGWSFGRIRILQPCSGISLRTASIRRGGQPWRVVWHYILVT